MYGFIPSFRKNLWGFNAMNFNRVKIPSSPLFRGLNYAFRINTLGFLKINQLKQFRSKSTHCKNLAVNEIKQITSLVVWGINLTSTVGMERFTKVVRNMIQLPSYQKSVIVGLILSDGWLRFSASP
uniref:orf125 n=1 Tax=Podospora anserina TaxID=2587412 RepID=UPI000016615C|nr:orf125 [Podospora anserina]